MKSEFTAKFPILIGLKRAQGPFLWITVSLFESSALIDADAMCLLGLNIVSSIHVNMFNGREKTRGGFKVRRTPM